MANKPSGEAMNVVYDWLKLASVNQLREAFYAAQHKDLSTFGGCDHCQLIMRQIIYVLQRYHFNIFYDRSDDETNIQESTDPKTR